MPTRKPLIFEKLKTFERPTTDAVPSPLNEDIFRTSVPGGWLILANAVQPTLLFYPDPRHEWDGGSMDA